MNGPLWLVLCNRPSCTCYVTGSNVDGARAQATRRCRHGRAPADVRFAGYSSEPDPTATRRPKGYAKAKRKRESMRLDDLPGRARHLVEVYLELRDGGSVRHEAAARTLLADVGAAILRVEPGESWALDLAQILDGDDAEGLRASLCMGLLLIDAGWREEEAFAFVDRARRIECKLGW